MPRVPAKGVHIDPELSVFLESIGPDHKLSRWIQDMADVLKENMFAGDLIEKQKIPKYYIKKYSVDHLYRYEHPEYHRSCYVIAQGNCIILDIMTHEEYNKRFGYRSN
mgnify:CR=1 FL=1